MDITFDNLLKVSFFFVALKNGFKNYIRYFDVERRCKNVVELDTGFENDIMESELGASLLE
ncbi:MAG: hypothetical protein SPG27_11380 [Butyricimonas virosa]|nr:hypothetical protein [Butyricimonas virosa]